MLQAALLVELAWMELGSLPDSFNPLYRLCNAHHSHIIDCLGKVLGQTFLVGSRGHVVLPSLLHLLCNSDFLFKRRYVRVNLLIDNGELFLEPLELVVDFF